MIKRESSNSLQTLNSKSLKCNFKKCRFSCISEKSLVKHQLQHRRDQLLCFLNPNGFTLNDQDVIVASSSESDPNLESCCIDNCKYDFFQSDETEDRLEMILAHLNTHVSSYIFYPCYNCLKLFDTNLKLTAHLKAKSKCQEYLENTLLSDILPDSFETKKRFSCSFCKNKYSRQKLLHLHFKLFHDNEEHVQTLSQEFLPPVDPKKTVTNKYKCTMCKERFDSLQLLDYHNQLFHFSMGFLNFNIEDIDQSPIELEMMSENDVICTLDNTTPSQLIIASNDIEFLGDVNEQESTQVNNSLPLQTTITAVPKENSNVQPASDDSKTIIVPEQLLSNDCIVLENFDKEPTPDGSQLFSAFIFECLVCNFSFKTETELSRHKNLVHNVSAFDCSRCEFVTLDVGKFRIHELMHAESQNMLVCPICSESFASKKLLETHEKEVHLNNQCHVCNLVVNSRAILNSHMISFHRSSILR